MKNIQIQKFFIIEDCDIQSGDNIIAEDDYEYTSSLKDAKQFISYDEAKSLILQIDEYYNAQVRGAFEINVDGEISHIYEEDLKEFLIDATDEI
jgi:hypothetical protein